MNILVTGGVGFIGSHIVDSYLAAGHTVFVLDNYSTKSPNELPKEVEIIRQDLKTCNLAKIFSDCSFDAVNHHAAQINVRKSIADPAMDAKENIICTIRLLQACVEAKKSVRRFIFASSGGAIYGDQELYPTDEDSPRKPASPYGLSKLTAETYIEYFRKTFSMSTVCLRYSNVYGPRQDPAGEAGVISVFADQFFKNEQPVIFGTGLQTRDFVYVKDVARANVAALSDNIQGVYNIGTAEETTVISLAEKIKATTKSEVDPKHGPAIAGEINRSCVAIDKAKTELDWQPRTALLSGLAETVSFIREKLNR